MIIGMTYNLRYAEQAGPNAWPVRRPLVAELLRQTAPDIIGTQEGRFGQLRDILADTGRYEWIGTGRNGGGRGEFCAVLYDPAKLAPVDYNHFWLSETPDTVGSTTPEWGNRLPRMATWVRFRLADGAELVWLNTHLDHKAAVARERAAALIVTRLADFDGPVVAAGDFNDVPGSPAYQAMLDAGFTDAWTATGRPEHGTYGGWGAPRPGGVRIDWVLTRGPVTARDAGISEYHDGEQWPSDHVPVTVTLEFRPAGRTDTPEV